VDLLTIILACSLHPDDQLVEAFIRKVSDANPLFLGDFVTLATHHDLTSPDQALELATPISTKGGRPALGLMAIPVSWAARFNREPADLLDACTNISIGTAMMASFATECGRHPCGRPRRVASKHSHRRNLVAVRACVLQGFDREIGVQGFTQILTEIPLLPARDPDTDPPPERSNVDDDAPTPRPQLPLEPRSVPSVGGPAKALPTPPRPSRPTPQGARNPPPALGGLRGSGSPPTPRAPPLMPRAGAARTRASPPAHRATPPAAPSLPMAAGPDRP
jgi:hypothetical protein